MNLEGDACWCTSGAPKASCCEPYLQGTAAPQSAAALMRARYSAFVTEDADFLRRTWHPATCPSTLEFNPEQRWLGLKILHTQAGAAHDEEGEVKFAARYKILGKGYRQTETSSFTKLGGQWVYVGGLVE